jgi:hypothetical protein
MSDSNDNISEQSNGVNFHRHCQNTIMSIYGHSGSSHDGNTQSVVDRLSLENLSTVFPGENGWV